MLCSLQITCPKLPCPQLNGFLRASQGSRADTTKCNNQHSNSCLAAGVFEPCQCVHYLLEEQADVEQRNKPGAQVSFLFEMRNRSLP